MERRPAPAALAPAVLGYAPESLEQLTGALGGKRNPRHKQVMDALENAERDFSRINAQKEKFDSPSGHVYPLKTEGWRDDAAKAVATRYDVFAFQSKKLSTVREIITRDKIEQALKAEAEGASVEPTGAELGNRAKRRGGGNVGLLGLGKETPHPLDDQAADLAVATRDAERDYLNTYEKALDAELKLAADAYLRSHKAYQDLPWEDDAFKTQAHVEKQLG